MFIYTQIIWREAARTHDDKTSDVIHDEEDDDYENDENEVGFF